LREGGEREASSNNVWPVEEGLGAPVFENAIEAIGALGRWATRILQRRNLALGWRQKGEPTANYWLMGEGRCGWKASFHG
jgi:hypothetical protein